GKWVQRYGYFEARMKLPAVPGLWPAFWMMPDRGPAADPQWKRQDTGNGGMEFDVMEHLTRWGHYRYNIAMHYDGYGKDHKQIGSEKVYVQPDKDGFLTCGLLWTPGSAVYYCNGQEVLRWENPRISNVPSILMFTLPAGGWDNNALDDKQLPADFVIDYVRVWQRKDLASAVDGKQSAVK
ncbi:MAG: glycoside hydrolase family 16 protein, partial [Armatimonadota bacterium]|nr:glycoside hydrolase family 16 protein [Armatimonadota bacterium]